jgi:hypothetical protein
MCVRPAYRAFNQPARFMRLKCRIEGCNGMGVQKVTYKYYFLGMAEVNIKQLLDVDLTLNPY